MWGGGAARGVRSTGRRVQAAARGRGAPDVPGRRATPRGTAASSALRAAFWRAASSARDGSGEAGVVCFNSLRGVYAVALVGDDLRQLVTSCLILKPTRKQPRPTFEAIAAAIAVAAAPPPHPKSENLRTC